MSAHPEAFKRLEIDLRRSKDRKIQDDLLDTWLEYRDLATDWDADQWGFSSDTWMEKERAELLTRFMSSNSDKAGRRLDRGVS